MPIRDILDRARHDGCGGRAGKAELLTGIEGATSRPVRRILLLDDQPKEIPGVHPGLQDGRV